MPYGYSQSAWESKSAVEQRKVRNWVVEQGASPIPQTDADLLIYDADWGNRPELNYKQSLSLGATLFPNTHQATVGKDDYVQAVKDVKHQDEIRARKQEELGRGFLRKLKPPAYKSFSGSDIIPTITIGTETFVIGNISAISYSIHRDKSPVRTLGRTYPKAYVGGGRTIAGTLVFTVFDRHVLDEIRTKIKARMSLGDGQRSPLSDEIPPFDVGINYRNEYGQSAYMRIYGIDIIDEGQNHSINDVLSENVMQYVARDIDLMMSVHQASDPQDLSSRNRYANSAVSDSKLSRYQSQLDAYNASVNLLVEERKKILEEKRIYEATGNSDWDEDINIINSRIIVIDSTLVATREAVANLTKLVNEESSINARSKSESGIGKMYNFDKPDGLSLPNIKRNR